MSSKNEEHPESTKHVPGADVLIDVAQQERGQLDSHPQNLNDNTEALWTSQPDLARPRNAGKTLELGSKIILNAKRELEEAISNSGTVEHSLHEPTKMSRVAPAEGEVSQSQTLRSSLPIEQGYLPEAGKLEQSSAHSSPRTSQTNDAPQGDSDWNEKEPPNNTIQQRLFAPEAEFDDRAKEGEIIEPKAEISQIIQQFGESQGHMLKENANSATGSEVPVFQYPPRSSSLEHRVEEQSGPMQMVTASMSSGTSRGRKSSYPTSVSSQPDPPEPDPEPDLPFDFHRFLEQLRHRTADPVAKFLRSFLLEFGKKQWQVHEQVKIITDFLTFISGKMTQCEVWKTVSDAEFDNAREGMEKLVMNRLYGQTFSPEIPPMDPSRNKGRRTATPVGPGRKGQHQEDVERDEVLAQRVRIYGWIREEHLDIRPFTDKGKKFLLLAQQELTKINTYRAPRDKVICVLNSCKVIFGYLRNAHSDQSADAFIPLLIYTVLKANPNHLVSNVQYILRFRNQDKLSGEAGYYMSSLLGAVQFIENLDRTDLTISDQEFEHNVEAAVSSIAEPHEEEKSLSQPSARPRPAFNEKSAPSRPEVTPRHSMEAERSTPRRGYSRQAELSGSEESEDNGVAGLLRTMQKPLSTIGRIFSDEGPTLSQQHPESSSHKSQLPISNNARLPGLSSMAQGLATARQQSPAVGEVTSDNHAEAIPTTKGTPPKEAAAVHTARVGAVEAHHVTKAEHETVVETLAGMFPDLDKDVISDVVRVKEGRIGTAVDACLALSR